MGGVHLPVLDAVSMAVAAGEFVSVIGPSGCGKSTLLNIVAGLEEPTQGTVLLDGAPANDRLGASAYMHQKDLLLPWRSVLDNAVLGLELRGVSRREAHRRAQALLPTFGLAGFEHQYPHALSGGMRQRAAFLRTVLAERPLLLLDEPFGALDALTRAGMQAWLLGLWQSLSKTIVLVTHDVDEALLLSDRVYVMTPRPGQVRTMLEVTLPRPRAYTLTTSHAFAQLRAGLLAMLWREGHEALR
ncbi:MAG: ABC transporter ATP-binding protein [Chloroflexi bacterium]|nr:ABC transporter ATP-binding protein [Chloroflexota bacterium]